ncbi:restriction endonuclease subunit S [Vibrio sp. 03-59-1]|uniref:restriction endonuclease subunit S n=1 Tax=Vibrio sp. 03-59-1 TaxID=2607607 RepID=UPI001493BEC9|nr:restriction endonuclease subunit S [Vibrio sp. 03-59-1]NOH84767.1 restriction endonuclease subunit S [Vibrio sp. 03-59-1]
MSNLLSTVAFTDLVNWSVRFLNTTNLDYKQEFKLYRIGDFLTRNRNTIEIEDEVEYRRVTVKLYSKGVTQRDSLMGKDIGTKRQFLISPGQFIMSKIDARNGAFGIVPDELDKAIVTADFLTYNIEENKIAPRFLHLLTATNQFIKFCENSSSGTTGRQRVKESEFLDIRIPLPDLPTQNRIVDAYDTKAIVASEHDQNAELLKVEIKKYFDKELGIKEIEHESIKGALNFIRFKNLAEWGVDKNHQTQIAQFDTQYNILKISELATVSSGGTPSRNRKDFYEKGTIPWVKTAEVVNAVINDTGEKITKLGLSNSSAKLYPIGSLIIAMYGQGATRGRTAKLGVNAATNQACAVLTSIDTTKVDTDYLWHYLMHEYDRIRALASGNNQPNLNAAMIKNYPVILPPLARQVEIVKVVSEVKERIKNSSSIARTLHVQTIEEFEKEIFE